MIVIHNYTFPLRAISMISDTRCNCMRVFLRNVRTVLVTRSTFLFIIRFTVFSIRVPVSPDLYKLTNNYTSNWSSPYELQLISYSLPGHAETGENRRNSEHIEQQRHIHQDVQVPGMRSMLGRVLRINVVLDKIQRRKHKVINSNLQSFDLGQCQVVVVQRIDQREEYQGRNSSQWEQQYSEVKVDKGNRPTAHSPQDPEENDGTAKAQERGSVEHSGHTDRADYKALAKGVRR